jgi:hypothetical protein
VNGWGAIGYGYKSPLVFVKGTGKKGAFKQKDYLAQVLEAYIQPILEAFAAVRFAAFCGAIIHGRWEFCSWP